MEPNFELLPVDDSPITTPTLVCSWCGGWRFVKRRKSPKGHQIYLCRVCGRHFTHNTDKFVPILNPEAEYEKDIWDCRNLGLKARIGRQQYKVNFVGIEQPWLLKAAKQYIRYTLATLSFSSGSEKVLALKRFSVFLAINYPTIEPADIDRSTIADFLLYIAGQNLSANTRCHTIGSMRSFFETCIQNEWVSFRRYLIRSEDFPKRLSSVPRFIPEDVMRQLNEHLSDLPEPVMRMVMVLTECGMRISELLFLESNCLLQDKSGDWFLRYYQFKMKKEITIPISRELVRVIQEQQRYITNALSIEKFVYLFCANEGGGCKGGFTASPKNMAAYTFSRYLNKLAERYNICDVTGSLWHFQAHQFRHSVGTRMINSGVPQHIVQRYLGHESPQMTAVYAHIFDQTMKEEVAKFHGKVVNVAGQVVESNVEIETADLEWFKRNIQAQSLPNGSCALPTISQGCPHANACLSCNHFRTTVEFLREHSQQLEQTEKIIDKAKANGWQRQVEMNEKIAINLRNIITSLEGTTDG